MRMAPLSIQPRFADRFEAGRALAAELSGYAHRRDVIVLALPRGGVPVGHEIARELGAPLDVFLVRKLGVPGHEELAMGAIASGGVRVLNPSVIETLGIAPETIERVASVERRELERREREYRENRPPIPVAGATAILVDDGLATGSTMLAAVKGLRARKPARIIVAVPVGASETCDRFRGEVDEIICLVTPQPFHAVGLWYEQFPQTSDEQVKELLEPVLSRR